MLHLTPLEEKVLTFLRVYVACNGFGPAWKELAAHCGHSSNGPAQRAVSQLNLKRAIALGPKIKGQKRRLRAVKITRLAA